MSLNKNLLNDTNIAMAGGLLDVHCSIGFQEV